VWYQLFLLPFTTYTSQYHIHLIRENPTVAGAESSNRFHAHHPHLPNVHSIFIDSSIIYFHRLLKVVANLHQDEHRKVSQKLNRNQVTHQDLTQYALFRKLLNSRIIKWSNSRCILDNKGRWFGKYLVCLMSSLGSSITMLQTQIVLPSTICVLSLNNHTTTIQFVCPISLQVAQYRCNQRNCWIYSVLLKRKHKIIHTWNLLATISSSRKYSGRPSDKNANLYCTKRKRKRCQLNKSRGILHQSLKVRNSFQIK
jgi:hypothetical protein